MPIDKGTTLPITQLSSLQINYKDQNSCLNPPIVTNTERDALVNTNDPNNPIKNGTLVFSSTDNCLQYYNSSSKQWIQIKPGAGTGDVTGPSTSVTNNIAVFNDTSGKVIKDGGATISAIKSLANNTNATPLYQISNLGALQFGSDENTADTGVILVDGLIPVKFQTQGTGSTAQICTVFNGELGGGSSSISALIEIDSTTGCLLNARMTTKQRDALVDPQNGMMLYNTNTQTFDVRQNNAWVSLGTGGGGSGTVTSVVIKSDNNNLTISGSPITSSGTIDITLSTALTSLTSVGTNKVNLITNSYNIGLTAPTTLSSNLNFVLPSDNGNNGQVLSTDGKGNTSWTDKSIYSPTLKVVSNETYNNPSLYNVLPEDSIILAIYQINVPKTTNFAIILPDINNDNIPNGKTYTIKGLVTVTAVPTNQIVLQTSTATSVQYIDYNVNKQVSQVYVPNNAYFTVMKVTSTTSLRYWAVVAQGSGVS
jgi:hypothetical protein